MGKAYEGIFAQGVAPEACHFGSSLGFLTGSCPILSLWVAEQPYSVTYESRFFFLDTILQLL